MPVLGFCQQYVSSRLTQNFVHSVERAFPCWVRSASSGRGSHGYAGVPQQVLASTPLLGTLVSGEYDDGVGWLLALAVGDLLGKSG